MSADKSVLIVVRSSPYGSQRAREAFDVALTTAIFDLPVTLLFISDGVFQLLDAQQPAAIGEKSIQSMLSSLPMYDIDQIYCSADDLSKRSLSAADLSLAAKPIDRKDIAKLINKHSTVFTY